MNEDNFLKVAKQAALKAGEIIAGHIGKKQEFTYKNNDKSNFATEADIKAEKAIIKLITATFPEHNIIAEEGGVTSKKSLYTWVIDPLDGTLSFSRNFPFYSVSIGLMFENKPILGVIYHVSAQDLYYAQENKGAFLNGKRIKISKIDLLEEGACGLDFGHKKSRAGNLEKYVNRLIGKIGYPYSVGSAVSTQALVAKGILDAYVNEAWIWDFAAGTVIIREAGGRVTDFEGNEPDWSKERLNVVASNGLIHDEILKVLK